MRAGAVRSELRVDVDHAVDADLAAVDVGAGTDCTSPHGTALGAT
jgi:hypothetical protein